MLITKEVSLNWNSKIKQHYVDLGYVYTKMRDPFIVRVEDLTKGSSANIEVECDYCKRHYTTKYETYVKSRINVNKDACNNPKCTGAKAKDALTNKYGAEYWLTPDIVEKRKQTNLERYGCENPFGNEEIKEKIRQHNLSKYGVEYCGQRPEVVAKRKQTCLEKYGVENYGKIYSETHSGELSSCWKGGVEYHRVERSTVEYRSWRKEVFERDGYKCQCCGIKNRKGLSKSIRLEAHHINDWKNNVSQRYDVNNGITFCERCHTQFHSDFGKSGNDNNQLQEFLYRYIDEKIC